MLKNVVFDLGNVLVSFKPADYLISRNYPEELRLRIIADIFSSREWLMLDNGDITTEQAREAIASRSSLRRSEIDRIFELRHEIIQPIPPNVNLLPELKKTGLKLYYLSNFPIDLWQQVTPKYGFFSFFDGGIISAEARASKPDRKIYEMLMEKYCLMPRECFYIDDLEANVATAISMGMTGLFTKASTDISGEVWQILRTYKSGT